jgi:hypothetical protein
MSLVTQYESVVTARSDLSKRFNGNKEKGRVAYALRHISAAKKNVRRILKTKRK